MEQDEAFAMTREQLDGLLEEIRDQQREHSDLDAQLLESEARPHPTPPSHLSPLRRTWPLRSPASAAAGASLFSRSQGVRAPERAWVFRGSLNWPLAVLCVRSAGDAAQR